MEAAQDIARDVEGLVIRHPIVNQTARCKRSRVINRREGATVVAKWLKDNFVGACNGERNEFHD